MRTKTIALAAGGAIALSTIGGVAFAVPALMATGSNATPSATTDETNGTDGTDGTETEPDDASESDRQAEQAARAARIAEQLSPLVDDGTLTGDQAAKVAEQLAEAMPDGRGGPRGWDGRGGLGDGHGPGGHGPRGVLGEALDTAAESLGVTVDELRTQLGEGATLGEIADAEGVERSDLVADLVEAATSEISERVDDGQLTQERADELLATIEEKVTESLDRSLSGPGDRRGPRGQTGTGEGDS